MDSHGRRQNMPFGYNPNGIHGIGLPSYMNSGQPPPQPGQPLLSEQETEQMQDFFSTFEAEHQAQGNPMHAQFTDTMAQLQQVQMPNTYVGHEVSMRSPQSSMDWHGQQMNPFQFGHPMNPMAMQTPTSPYGHTNGHMASPVNNMFPMHQNSMQNFNTTWQQAFPTHPMHGPRADVNFGSDPNFLSNGYTAPDGTMDADLSLLSYAMAPTSSASNTQPNSRPGSNANTEPSSPVTTKKRKLNTFQSASLRMTPANGTQPNGVSTTRSPPQSSARKPRKAVVKNEQPHTPLSKTPTTHDEDDVQEEDAEYDEEDPDDQPRSPSPPAPWPASKARPVYKEPPPPKPAKPRKQSKSSASPAKPPKPRRTLSAATNSIARMPLTAEQKKANHTNSEQRRRDATARSYAELYDMVPELNDIGKQSTMKKLEVVVDKVHNVKARLDYLRQQLGRDVVTGQLLPGKIAKTQYSGDMSHISGWALPGQH